MIARVGTWVVCAGLVAGAGGCAGRQQARQESPASKQISASQERSQVALDEAALAQRRASEQAQRASNARREAERAEAEARAAQQRATAAQQTYRAEQARAVQAQEQANRAAGEASGVAAQAQQQASRHLSEQQGEAGPGERVHTGEVVEADRGRLVVSSDRGSVSFAVTPRTQVEVDGRQGTLADIQPGADARVSYDEAAGGATATRIVVKSSGTR